MPLTAICIKYLWLLASSPTVYFEVIPKLFDRLSNINSRVVLALLTSLVRSNVSTILSWSLITLVGDWLIDDY
jgi:hypothetical protein